MIAPARKFFNGTILLSCHKRQKYKIPTLLNEVVMSKFIHINDRTSSSVESNDKTYRIRNRLAWDRVSESLPDDAFADDVEPDASDVLGKIEKKQTYIFSKNLIDT